MNIKPILIGTLLSLVIASTSGCAMVGIATAIGCDTVTVGMMSDSCASIGELIAEGE
tara:strand:+ start:1363 stop:1533 length:171 start_codon:yes stop_codon:yes gene_type:complete